MAIHQIGTVYNGGGTVFCGEKVPATYIDTSRLHSVSNISGTQFYVNLDGKYYEGSVLPQSPSDIASGTNANAVVRLLSAGSGTRHVLYSVGWGYSETPTGGQFSVQSPSGTTIYGPVPITSAGAGFHEWEHGLKGSVGGDLLATIKAGGSGVVGYIDISERGYGG